MILVIQITAVTAFIIGLLVLSGALRESAKNRCVGNNKRHEASYRALIAVALFLISLFLLIAATEL